MLKVKPQTPKTTMNYFLKSGPLAIISAKTPKFCGSDVGFYEMILLSVIKLE
jgi:hypothetical protein